MSFFPSTVRAVLGGEVVNAALLAFFDFLSTPMRIWQGFGAIVAGGYTWQGIGQLGSVTDIESAIGGTAPQVTFSLSGVEGSAIAAALDASDEVKGRAVVVYLQFFNADWSTLDDPYAVWSGTMDQMRVKASAEARTIELTAETLFSRRGMPPFGYLTDRDQQALFPGDRGLEQIPSMVRKVVKWPNT